MIAQIRHDWSLADLRAIHDLPLMDLVYRAATVHRQNHDPSEMQVSKLISIKTGACPEDCSYCAQSSRYTTGVAPERLMETGRVLEIATRAKEAGVSRVCLGAAWREVKDNAQFDRVLEMVRGVTDMGLEVCCTLGMLNEQQAQRLEEAGLYAYNHNVDSSAEFYETIITTRTYADRLKTLETVRKTNITMCSGGIIGLGETVEDRLKMVQTLSQVRPHPESVPINILSRVDGTPLAKNADVPVWEVIRMIATVRMVMPKSDVRLTAGRVQLDDTAQALCFMAGANSIFSSETEFMLTRAVPSPSYDKDRELLAALGLHQREPFKNGRPQDKVPPLA
ncbi:MAG: biotin synthase BioB [Pedosphaera sp.]|nr:biotin synthase BioB [Pedosphaera sp.]